MPRVVLISDDLTGAADSAAPFASYGLSTRLLLERGDEPADPDVVGISTNSRERDGDSARESILAACRWVRTRMPDNSLIFKKIDSTLRGHIAEELGVVVREFGIERLLLSPAFPSQGRTTLNGRHHVHGIPLNRTTFSSEEQSDDLIERFATSSPLRPKHIPIDLLRGSQPLAPHFDESGMFIPDIQSDADMLRFVKAGLQAGITHFCGAGGLSWALARTVGKRAGSTRDGFALRSPALIVAGSLNQATIDQVDAAGTAGFRVFGLPGDEENWHNDVLSHLGRGQDVIISSQHGRKAQYDPAEVRALLGGSVSSILRAIIPGVIVMTGGDVAAALCEELGVTAIEFRDEVEPGIPVGMLESNEFPNLPVITKAGGFGDRHTFVRLLESIRRE